MWFGGAKEIWERRPEGLHWDIMICAIDPLSLAADYAPRFYYSHTFNSRAAELLPLASEIVEPAAIEINWPDYGTPRKTRAWWERLVKDLSALEDPTGAEINCAVYCQGGHGRTGTMATIIGHLAMWPSGENPLKWVRDNYCWNSVETDHQVDYLQRIIPEADFTEFSGTSERYSYGGSHNYNSHAPSSGVGSGDFLISTTIDPVEGTTTEVRYRKSLNGQWGTVRIIKDTETGVVLSAVSLGASELKAELYKSPRQDEPEETETH